MDYHVETVPLAIDYASSHRQPIPSGVFSTADLLMEAMITGNWTGRTRPVLNLNHHVLQIETSNHRVTSVLARDLVGG